VNLMRAGRGAVLLHVCCVSSAVTLACTESQLSVTAPQGSKCQVSATSNQSAFPFSGGAGSVEIHTTRDCTWTVQADTSWIAIGGGRSHSGQGEAVIQYQVEANPTNRERAGMLVVSESRIQIEQAAAPCRFVLSPTRQTLSPSGGPTSVAVTTSEGCRWRALSQDAWIRVASDAERAGSASVALEVARNEGAAREGRVVVEGQLFTVAQAGAGASPPPHPSPSPAPTPSPAPSPGPPDPSSDPIEIDGEVASLLGICPLVTFSVDGRSITTNLTTDFRDGRCSDLSNGDDVTVRGRVQASGVLLADRIRFRDGGRGKGGNDDDKDD
jgi:hypothetical protein